MAAQDAALRRELHQLQEALGHRTAACVDAEGRVQALTAEVADFNTQLKRNSDLLSECQVGDADAPRLESLLQDPGCMVVGSAGKLLSTFWGSQAGANESLTEAWSETGGCPVAGNYEVLLE